MQEQFRQLPYPVPDTDVVSLHKTATGEVYMVIFPPDQGCEAIQAIGRWARNPDLSFTWFDAAALSENVSAIYHQHKESNS